MSKVIIPNADGTYGVVEWIKMPSKLDYVSYPTCNYYEHDIGVWQKLLASQPQTKVHPSHTKWAEDNLYKEIQDGEIAIDTCNCSHPHRCIYKDINSICQKLHYAHPVAQLNHEAVKDLWEEAETKFEYSDGIIKMLEANGFKEVEKNHWADDDGYLSITPDVQGKELSIQHQSGYHFFVPNNYYAMIGVLYHYLPFKISV